MSLAIRARRSPVLALLALLLAQAPLFAAAAAPAPKPPAPLPPDVDQSWIKTTPKDAPRLIALTFDDGPAAGSGEKILDALKAHKWLATFCLIGQNLESHVALGKRMVAEGHEIAGHSWSHKNLTQLDADGVSKEVGDCLKMIKKTLDVDTHWFRTPFTAITPALRDRIRNEFNCAILGVTLDSEDWKRPPAGTVTKNLLNNIPDGSVILCHEWNDQTATELPALITELEKRGYKSVTVTQLLATRAFKAK